MTLIASLSGIRGTIGGSVGENFTPPDIIRFCSAYAVYLEAQKNSSKKLILGYDGRPSREMVFSLVSAYFQALGYEIVFLGLTTTPTVQMAIANENAVGGIMISASHNPEEWNALKLFNSLGEFISPADARKVIENYQQQKHPVFAPINKLGKLLSKHDFYLDYHIKEILKLPLVTPEKIRARNFKIVVDGINSSGAVFVPRLLETLGVSEVEVLNSEVGKGFNHTPEPLPENMQQIMQAVKNSGADLGIVIDPDVDRLAFIMENGEPFGEEYTLVAVADYVLSETPSPTVSNLSSTQALRILTEEKYGQKYYASAVGEINVVQKMKETGAKIGGEGNGGVIYPELHYGRDALVGIALFLSFLARENLKISELRKRYPTFVMLKDKVSVAGKKPDELLKSLRENPPFSEADINTLDGVKFIFPRKWIHVRKSNTEPIIRIYAEGEDLEELQKDIQRVKQRF